MIKIISSNPNKIPQESPTTKILWEKRFPRVGIWTNELVTLIFLSGQNILAGICVPPLYLTDGHWPAPSESPATLTRACTCSKSSHFKTDFSPGAAIARRPSRSSPKPLPSITTTPRSSSRPSIAPFTDQFAQVSIFGFILGLSTLPHAA